MGALHINCPHRKDCSHDLPGSCVAKAPSPMTIITEMLTTGRVVADICTCHCRSGMTRQLQLRQTYRLARCMCSYVTMAKRTLSTSSDALRMRMQAKVS